MHVVMLRSFRSLGNAGDVVNVKPGYAKNYLIPMGVVVVATPKKIKEIEEKKDLLLKEDVASKSTAEKIKSFLQKDFIVFIRAAGDDGRLYGSVSTVDIVREVNNIIKENNLAEKFTISRASVDMISIRSIGIYHCNINLYGDVYAKVGLNVARTVSDAKINQQEFESRKTEEAKKAEESNSVEKKEPIEN